MRRHRISVTGSLGAVLVLGCSLLLGAGPASAAGPWGWPLDGPHAVVRPFDPPATRYGPGHRGADLPGRVGSPVRAAGAGRVAYAGLLAGRGVVVVVHGALRTTYEPVRASVRVGQAVTAGQGIGALTSGHPGCPSACLHWGLLRGEVYLDPVRLVRAGPSRLLPVTGPVAGVVAGVVADPVAPPAGHPALAAVTPTHAATRAAAPAAAPDVAPATEPRLVLRAADAGWGTAAVVALVAGLLLLRPRRGPDGPGAPSAAAALPTDPVASALGLVDLSSERQRRRSAVAEAAQRAP